VPHEEVKAWVASFNYS